MSESQGLTSTTFVPALLFHEPDRRVHPCQGTLLCVRLRGLDAAAGTLDLGQAIEAARLQQSLKTLLELLSEDAEGFGGEQIELHASGQVYFFRDQISLQQSVLQALAAAQHLRKVVIRWLDAQSASVRNHVRVQLGVASGIFHGVVLGNIDASPQMVFTGAVVEEASKAAEQAAASEVVIHPSAGGRITAELAITTPSLPTPALCRFESLHPSVDQTALRTETGGARVQTPLLLVRPLGIPLNEGPQRSCVLSVQVSGVDPASSSGLAALNTWYERSLKVIGERGGRLLRLEVGALGRMDVLFDVTAGLVDLEGRALRCALALQRVARDLPALYNQRLGIASGYALVLRLRGGAWPCYGALGMRLDQAYRLSTLAGPWEILAERQTVSRSGFGFDWGPPPVSNAVNEQDLVTSRVLYGEGAYGTKLNSRSRGELVGRESLMARLRELADSTLAGNSRAVSLVGAPGIGKSALVLWFGTFLQEQRRVPVYRGECSALIRHAPYHAWIPVFRDWLDLQPELSTADQVARIAQRIETLGADLLPRLPLMGMLTGVRIPENATTEGLDSRQRRDALHALVLDLFRRAHHSIPMGMLFEDAHWMDEASLGLLRYLSRNLGRLPIFMLISRRDEEPGQHEVLKALESLPSVVELEVGGMTREAMIALACRHLGATHLTPDFEKILLERAEGVPLLLEELTLLMRDAEWVVVGPEGLGALAPDIAQAIPRGIREVVLARVARLDEGAQLTLKTASVIGRTFSLSLLREVYPVPFDFSVLSARLERVEGLDIVRQDSAGLNSRRAEDSLEGASASSEQLFFFKHALIRDTLYETIPPSTRRSLHEAIAQALERRLTDDNRAELVLAIAEHYRRTVRTEKQRVYLREAGDISRARGQNRDAYEYFQAAEQLSQLIGNRVEVAELLEAQATVLNFLGDREAQREVLGRWKEVARELEDERYLSDALRVEGSLLARSGQSGRALQILERSLSIARNKGDRRRTALTLRPLCRLYYLQNDLPKALVAAEEALELMIAEENWQQVSLDETNVGLILSRMNRRDEGRSKMEEALSRAQARGDILGVGGILNNLGLLDMEEGLLDRALRVWERALALKRQVGDRQDEAISLNNMGFTAFSLGDFIRALEYCQEALMISQQIESPWIETAARNNLSQIYLAVSDLKLAREHCLESVRLCEAGVFQSALEEALLILSTLELQDGNLDAAFSAVKRGLELVPHRPRLRALQAVILMRKGLPVDAIRDADAALEEYEKNADKSENSCNLKYNLSKVYEAVNPELSVRLLQEARQELLERAQRIQEVGLRRQMLELVPENRIILDDWDRLESSIET